MAMPDCVPGLYIGTYNCEVDIDILGGPLPLAGDVSFNLERNQKPSGTMCQEFCAELEIAEGTGTLFGVVGPLAFEAKLSGGVDCRTGEFRASAPMGRYGAGESTDPSDPDALWTVGDPPLGNFEGTLHGTYRTPAPPAIRGDWNLADVGSGAACMGPFEVTLTRP